jgi:4-diphosphocytidyl-2-C-methyl-D-erythritol kinase
MRISEPARAKINLTLSVLGRRPDGYHDIESLVTFAEVGDRVSLLPGAAPSLTTRGPFAAAIDNENLLQRALSLLAGNAPSLRLGAVDLEKNLPVAAGLGGGSADAAALLRAVRRANPDHADVIPWVEVAARLGADVTVCLGDRPALISGVGEVIEALARGPQSPSTMAAVLANPGLSLATASVFRALAGPAITSTRRPAAAPAGPFADLDALLAYCRARSNDLERPAVSLLPPIADIKAGLAAQGGCRFAAMSGSGPTCFGIFADEKAAARAATALRIVQPDWWITATRLDWPA